ncbi:prolyl oligopeptidase family serine peptidase [Sphingomonas sp. HITSZ_GF]|uniref:alpha/beta hydrolase family protein n=1 Tax=Sphingomonas sp. HITSZ_GF TaxID=3037247 RepID=UPI00240DC020|nr:prolyl oligopeptidase family serine peptidase [Sphingomonas sp. HITSZ_GF]MDG2535902.1 prolyl oligopeptidase family serine peptidase [Sphingomonas sp. HITSZ_GF]
MFPSLKVRARRVLALALLIALPAVAQAQIAEGKHAFSFEDARQRSEIRAAVAAPDGTSVAVQVTRPMADPGLHAGAARSSVQPRGDIWLFDRALAHPQKLPAANLWTWAPTYSPSGRKLAALCADAYGRVGLIVWNLVDRSPRRFSHVEVDVNALLRMDGDPDVQSSGSALRTRPFVWLDERTLVFVDRDGVLQQYALAPATAPATYAALRSRTRAGKLSVRVWNAESPTEGAASRLMTLDVTTGRTKVLYRGDVRGVSVSPDRSQAALLVATRHLAPAPGSMEPALRAYHLYDDSVVLALVVQPLKAGEAGRVVKGAEGTGVVAESRLPVWSDDGRRIGLVGRATYTARASSGDDFAFEVQVPALSLRRIAARSALDAELLANMLADYGSDAGEVLTRRPMLPSDDTRLPLGQPPGKAWRISSRAYLLLSARQVQVFTPQGITTLPGAFDSGFAADLRGAVPRFVLGRGRQDFDLRFVDGKPVLTEIARPPQADLLVATGYRGLTLYKRDSDAGTSLHLVEDGVPARMAMPFNRHLAAVAEPAMRELRLELNGRQLTGILRLPPGRHPNDRHPVVLMAYPGYMPRIGDSMHRVNSNSITHEPFYHLLSQGFAVFVVPFPLTLGLSPEGPLQAAVDTVMPWLPVLDRQPEVLAGEYAYWGHSNGGYVGLALETRTSAFKAIAVSSSFPDLHWTLDAGLEFSALDSAGEIMQARRFVYEYEAQPYSLGAPPWKAEGEWIRNSPGLNLEKASTPMLLLEGEFDFATSRPMERVYSTLRGKGVPAEMAQYWGEAHIIASPENVLDSWTRTERFFRKFLRMH